jgi:hypothetical protein
MYQKKIINLIIIALIVLAKPVVSDEHDSIAKPNSNLIIYGLDLDGFEDALLAQILSYQKADYYISRYTKWLPRGRAFDLMSKEQGIDIVWGSATNERFKSYLPVKIPIYKGLIGWRLALVKQGNQNIFAQIRNLAELREFTPGQQLNWSDYRIFRENGFDVTSGVNRDALAEMLTLGRFDFFPRAVIEIEKELRDFADIGLSLEPHVLIRYKSAYVFYVAKNNTELAKQLHDGLIKSKDDGSFDALFEQHFKALFERWDLSKRTIIQLNNPLIPTQMLEIDEHFWISPQALVNKSN